MSSKYLLTFDLHLIYEIFKLTHLVCQVNHGLPSQHVNHVAAGLCPKTQELCIYKHQNQNVMKRAVNFKCMYSLLNSYILTLSLPSYARDGKRGKSSACTHLQQTGFSTFPSLGLPSVQDFCLLVKMPCPVTALDSLTSGNTGSDFGLNGYLSFSRDSTRLT